MKMVDVGRRKFLTGAGLAAAAPLPRSRRPEAKAAPGAGAGRLPIEPAGQRSRSQAERAAERHYPDSDAPGVLINSASACRAASVPDGDIVGFSTICPHKGFPLAYNKADRTLNCPGHYSRFDCEAGGQQIWGQATQNLPQYVLRVDDKGDIYAEGVDELLYGRLSNVL